ncbi:RYamide receptor [Carabus blaptoides fortunei]
MAFILCRTRLMVYPRYHLPDLTVTKASRVTNYFLVNLSAADLLVTVVCMPYAIWNASQNIWYLGNISCMLIGYLQCVAVGASVFTITAMAIDRYLAITQPIGFPRWFNKTSTTIVILTLWLVSLFIFSPMLWISQTKIITVMNHTVPPLEWPVCQEDWTTFMEYKIYIGVFWFAITYVVPGILMVVAYSLMGRRLCSVRPPFDTHEGSASTQQGFRLVRERKRVAWILLLLALLFAACWLPHSILNLLLDTGDFTASKWLMPYCILLGHANSAINPIIYCFMTRNFRRSVKELVFRTRNNFTTRRTNRGQVSYSMN